MFFQKFNLFTMENELPKIEFSYNWNSKLHCKCFTTIRLHNPNKYVIGQRYYICLELLEFIAEIVNIKQFRLSQLNDYMAMLDTGYGVQETTEIIKKMYPNIDFENQLFDFILLKRESKIKRKK